MDNTITYWDYLKLESLLQLQGGLNSGKTVDSEDELHFIIVHQVFELWFKLIISELKLVISKMNSAHVAEEIIPFSVQHLKRINTTLSLAIEHFNLMETLTPQDFLAFRSKLETASGFQSFQMRIIEYMLGLEQLEREKHGHSDPVTVIIRSVNSRFGNDIKGQLEQAEISKSLRDVIHSWLYRTPIHGSKPKDEHDSTIVQNFIREYLKKQQLINRKQLKKMQSEGNIEEISKRMSQSEMESKEFLEAMDIDQEKRARIKRIRAAILFIESYRDLPLLAWPRLLIDTIVELEELFTKFRFQHARMVERIIGRRVGTGGSSGVDYLDETTNYRVFPELWAVRTLLLPKSGLPVLKNRHMYRFVSES